MLFNNPFYRMDTIDDDFAKNTDRQSSGIYLIILTFFVKMTIILDKLIFFILFYKKIRFLLDAGIWFAYI